MMKVTEIKHIASLIKRGTHTALTHDGARWAEIDRTNCLEIARTIAKYIEILHKAQAESEGWG